MSQKKDYSKLDQVQQQRSSYLTEENAQALVKLNSMVPNRYTRHVSEHDVVGNITKVTFFDDDVCEESRTTCGPDISASLNNTYFVLNSARDITLYHVWYNVSGGGTDPAPALSTGIEVTIATDEPGPVVALATQQAVDSVFEFKATNNSGSSVLDIQTVMGGVTTDTADNDTGFSFETITQGASRTVSIVVLEYDVDSNLTTAYKTFKA